MTWFYLLCAALLIGAELNTILRARRRHRREQGAAQAQQGAAVGTSAQGADPTAGLPGDATSDQGVDPTSGADPASGLGAEPASGTGPGTTSPSRTGATRPRAGRRGPE